MLHLSAPLFEVFWKENGQFVFRRRIRSPESDASCFNHQPSLQQSRQAALSVQKISMTRIAGDCFS